MDLFSVKFKVVPDSDATSTKTSVAYLDNVSVVLVLIFIPARSHAAENQ